MRDKNRCGDEAGGGVAVTQDGLVRDGLVRDWVDGDVSQAHSFDPQIF